LLRKAGFAEVEIRHEAGLDAAEWVEKTE